MLHACSRLHAWSTAQQNKINYYCGILDNTKTLRIFVTFKDSNTIARPAMKTKAAAGPTVLMTLELVANSQTLEIALGGQQASPAQKAAMAAHLENGAYITVEFMSDGTARVKPVTA